MDPLRDMRWAARADRSMNRATSWRAAKICIGLIVLTIIASLTDDRGPHLWRSIASAVQRRGIGLAVIAGAMAILFWTDSRRRLLEEPRSLSFVLIVALVAALIVVGITFWILADASNGFPAL